MGKKPFPFLGRLLPENLELLDTHAPNSANLKLTPGSDEPHSLVDFTIVWREEKFRFQCFSPCFVEVQESDADIKSLEVTSPNQGKKESSCCSPSSSQMFKYIKNLHRTIAFSGRNTYFALIIGGVFIRFMCISFAMNIDVKLSPIYDLNESKTQEMVYKFFRTKAIEKCVRVVESDYFYFDEGWKLRFPGDVPMTIPCPKNIYGTDLSLVYVEGKYVLKFNPEEHLAHHIRDELLVYRHILSEKIPNTMQLLSYIEIENHLLLLFEGHGEKEFVHEYFYELFSCLQHFHDRVRYVHRDVRPANIVFIDKKPCLIDFAFCQPLVPPDLTEAECLKISTVFKNRLDLTQEDFTEKRLLITLKGCVKKKRTLLKVCGFIHRYFMERIEFFRIEDIIKEIVRLFSRSMGYWGSNETASNRILELLKDGRSHVYCIPADDLDSAIKSYCLFRCAELRDKVGINDGYYTNLISIWNQFIDQNAFLTQYFKHAEDMDYEGLIELFKRDSRLKELKDIPLPPERDEIPQTFEDFFADCSSFSLVPPRFRP